MNYMNGCVLDTRTPGCDTPVEHENLKTLMRMTNERLNEALARAETILSEIRGAYPRKDEEPPHVSSALEGERLNRDIAEHLCVCLREIALELGVE